jgi:1-carboxybiuret hydrolase
VQDAADRVAAALGASGLVEMDDAAAARAAAFLITSAEGAQMHIADLRTRADEFDPMVRDRMLAGLMVPAQWVLHAQRMRSIFRARAAALFADWDILVAPASPTPATPIGQETLEADGEVVKLRPSLGVYTQPISYIGLPVLAAPVQGVQQNLPTGVQLIAAPWREDVLFRAAAVLEQAGICTAPVAPAFA